MTLAARSELDTYDFCMHRELGVCAFAVAAGGGSALLDFGGYASSLIVRTIASNCHHARGLVDLNVQKFEPSASDVYGPGRLVASIKSANQRLREGAREHFKARLKGRREGSLPGIASVSALIPVESGLMTMQVGAQARIYRVREGQVALVSPPRELLFETPDGQAIDFLRPPYSSLGSDDDCDVLVREVVPHSGDIFVMCAANADGVSEALQRLAREPFEQALAACFGVVQREPILLVRWVSRG